MTTPKQALTKTCVSCGQQKPLSAFLQLSDSQGSSYGNLCANCRKANTEAPEIKESEESSRTTSGKKVDAKARVAAEADKRDLRREIDERYYEEREKDAEIETQQIQKGDVKIKSEKKHRDFLEKRSFLDSAGKNKNAPPQQSAAAESAAREPDINFSAPFADTHIAGKVKYQQSSIYQQFKSWLGNAPIVSAAERAIQQAKKGLQTDKKSHPQTKDHAEKDSIIDQAEKITGPSKRR